MVYFINTLSKCASRKSLLLHLPLSPVHQSDPAAAARVWEMLRRIPKISICIIQIKSGKKEKRFHLKEGGNVAWVANWLLNGRISKSHDVVTFCTNSLQLRAKLLSSNNNKPLVLRCVCARWPSSLAAVKAPTA